MDVLSCNAESCDTHTLCVNDVSPATDTVLHTTTVTAEHSAGNLQKVMDITRFSTLGKLLRVTAYVLRFISKLRKRTHVPQDKYISVLELRDAKRLWINAVQSDTFACEIKSIQRNTKCALVYQLKLFIDSDGVIRCGGRFQNADLQYGQKFPILLPTKHLFSLLEIAHAHSVILHSGVGATITHLRQTLWIPKIRQVVKSILKRCRQCLAVNGYPYAKPTTPPLPACRIRETPPFLVTGVDFTGVLYYKTPQSNRNKAYVCLYTCAITRGIHLEIVPDMSTEAFLRSFRRFASRRSLPNRMISDNGTTFLSANETLKGIFTSTRVLTYLASRQVNWTFIPKRAPWFGGFYERLIGITKTTLRKVLGRACVTVDELNTLITEIEAVINDRPLTFVASDSDELETALTPSHLINGRMLTILPHRVVDDDELLDPDFSLQAATDLQKSSVYLDKLFGHLWSRWRNEYLPALREQQISNSKPGSTDNSIRVGDVVLVHSDTDKRVNWGGMESSLF